MPYQKNGKRNYKLEYALYHSKPEQRHNRSLRTIARNEAITEGRVKRGDGKDIDHTQPSQKEALMHEATRASRLNHAIAHLPAMQMGR